MPKDLDREAQARRDFLKTAGRVAVTAPAVALLLSAAAKPASASDRYGGGGGGCGGVRDKIRRLEREHEALHERRWSRRHRWHRSDRWHD